MTDIWNVLFVEYGNPLRWNRSGAPNGLLERTWEERKKIGTLVGIVEYHKIQIAFRLSLGGLGENVEPGINIIQQMDVRCGKE